MTPEQEQHVADALNEPFRRWWNGPDFADIFNRQDITGQCGGLTKADLVRGAQIYANQQMLADIKKVWLDEQPVVEPPTQ